MKRVAFLFAVLVLLPIASLAKSPLGGLARVLPDGIEINKKSGSRFEIALPLSQPVPYRVFHALNPNRLVVEMNTLDLQKEIVWQRDGVHPVSALRSRILENGWARLSFEMREPFRVILLELEAPVDSSKRILRLELNSVTEEDFAALARHDAKLQLGLPVDIEYREAQKSDNHTTTIVLDPGHGGYDPGALVSGIKEADVMLTLAYELEEALLRAANINVVMTRRTDGFLPLDKRVAVAQDVEADLFISLHADIVTQGVAEGTTVYTLSKVASDALSASLATDHDRAASLGGLDLRGEDDDIAETLLDLTMVETQPRSAAFARTLIETLKANDIRVNRKPLRSAAFSVLKAPDIPSVLIEAGFMSTPRDLQNLTDKEWRTRYVTTLATGIVTWLEQEQYLKPLRRK